MSCEHLKDLPGHSLGGSGPHLQGDRASMRCEHPEDLPGHLLGGCGDLFQEARACTRHEQPKDCQGDSLGGSGDQCQQGRAGTLSSSHNECPGVGVSHQDRALHGAWTGTHLHGIGPPDSKALPRHDVGGRWIWRWKRPVWSLWCR